jgi:hypothetical protein
MVLREEPNKGATLKPPDPQAAPAQHTAAAEYTAAGHSSSTQGNAISRKHTIKSVNTLSPACDCAVAVLLLSALDMLLLPIPSH